MRNPKKKQFCLDLCFGSLLKLEVEELLELLLLGFCRSCSLWCRSDRFHVYNRSFLLLKMVLLATKMIFFIIKPFGESEHVLFERSQRVRKETSRSDQMLLTLSGFSWNVLKLQPPHRTFGPCASAIASPVLVLWGGLSWGPLVSQPISQQTELPPTTLLHALNLLSQSGPTVLHYTDVSKLHETLLRCYRYFIFPLTLVSD